MVQAQVGAVGASFLRARPWLVAGPVLVSPLALVMTGEPWFRVALLAGVQGAMLSFFIWEAVELSRGGPAFVSTRRLGWSLAITLTGIGVCCGLTGAARSPFLPMLLAPTGIAFAAFGARPGGLRFLGYLGVWLGLLMAFGALDPWPPLAPVALTMFGFVAVGLAGGLLWVGVAALTSAHGAAVRDVDRLRTVAMQEASARVRDLEAIGAKVAHELKNPLAAVQALTQLNAREATGAPAERYGVIEEELKRMTATLDRYLDYARPPEGVRWQSVAPADVLRRAAAVVEGRAVAMDITLVLRTEPGVAMVDPDRLHEAILNLVTNALDASPRGSKVQLSMAVSDTEVVFTVEDAGSGMDPEVVRRLGTPYFTTRDGGTGLGVLLARAVAREHGGDLTYDSQSGQGTTATLTVPVRPGVQPLTPKEVPDGQSPDHR